MHPPAPAPLILVVEDEDAIREMVVAALSAAGYRTAEAADAAGAREALERSRPDLVLLDWMLPGVSGLEFARRLRREERTRELPIIMLTARAEEADRVTGLEAGADDYLGKPFSLRELIARIRAVLRRVSGDEAGEVLHADGLRLDTASHRVSADGESLRMGPTEFRLLRFLMSRPDRVFTRAQLLDGVWGHDVYVEERTVDVHIRRLRRSLAPHGYDALIQTVYGTGYRFSRHP